jgi:hypothetical protein
MTYSTLLRNVRLPFFLLSLSGMAQAAGCNADEPPPVAPQDSSSREENPPPQHHPVECPLDGLRLVLSGRYDIPLSHGEVEVYASRSGGSDHLVGAASRDLTRVPMTQNKVSLVGDGTYHVEVRRPDGSMLVARDYFVGLTTTRRINGCYGQAVEDKLSMSDVVPDDVWVCGRANEVSGIIERPSLPPSVNFFVDLGRITARQIGGNYIFPDEVALALLRVSYRTASGVEADAPCTYDGKYVENEIDMADPFSLTADYVALCEAPWPEDGPIELTARIADGREARRIVSTEGPIGVAPGGRGADAWRCYEGRAWVVGASFELEGQGAYLASGPSPATRLRA